MSIKLKKKLLLLGGNGKIGSEIAFKFLENNYQVIVLDKTNSKFKKNIKNLYFEKIDFKIINNIEKKLKKILKKYGTPDTLINASYPTSKDWINCSFDKVKLNYFLENLNMHLGSYYWSSKVVADYMKMKNQGSIIMISSIYSVVSQDPEMYKGTNLVDNQVYPIIKAGINAFVRQMSSFYGRYNIRLNNVCPGGLEDQIKGSRVKQNKNFKSNYLSKLSIKRFCQTSDISEACLFLSDGNKSSYITGQNIIIDGGYTSK